MADLRVEMHGELLGNLVGRRSSFDFVTSNDTVRAHGLGSHLISLAVPLVPRASSRDVQLRRNFFAELLPEGDARPPGGPGGWTWANAPTP
jgi:serine/threonine-protein kinase HipA